MCPKSSDSCIASSSKLISLHGEWQEFKHAEDWTTIFTWYMSLINYDLKHFDFHCNHKRNKKNLDYTSFVFRVIDLITIICNQVMDS